MRSRLVISIMVLVAGCAYYRGPGQDNVSFNTSLAPDSVIKLAEVALTQNGFSVVKQNPSTVTTVAREVPPGADTSDTGRHFRFWIMRIDAVPAPLTSGTDVRIAGFFLPTAAPTADSASVARAITVTAANTALFAQIDAVANATKEAANKRR